MDGLEYIVRPWQSPNSHGAIIIPSTPSTSRERATLTWGAKTQGVMPVPKTVNYVWPCCREVLTEITRDVERKRIIGNDGVSYIDVDRPKIVQLGKKATHRCNTPLEQDSYVAASLNADLDSWDNLFAGYDDKPEDQCKTTWNLSNG